MRLTCLLVPVFLFFAPALRAQYPIPAGHSTVLEGSAGYQYLSLGTPSDGRSILHGVDVNLTGDIHRSFGLRLDGSYALGANPYRSGDRPSILTYMGGPVVYPLRHQNVSVYGQALLGGALVSDTVPANGGGFLTGRVNRFAWTAGMGVQIRDNSAFSYRLGVDYLRASFTNSAAVIQPASSYRVVASLVYSFGRRPRTRR